MRAAGPPEPYYAAESATLYHGDALAVLARMPDASVDAVITDPPYSSGGQYRGDRIKGTGDKYVSGNLTTQRDLVDFSGDNRDQRGFAYWCALWMGECLRVTRDGGLFMSFTDWRQLPSLTDSLQAGGWLWRGIIPWNKPNARVFAGRITNACEYVAWGSKGALPNPMDGGVGFPGFVIASSPRERDHQAQKPLAVMRELMASVTAGGTVLDPFAGAGTTGVAALIEGRRFIGVEMNAHHVETAANRLRQTAVLPSARDKQETLDLAAALGA